ncbi:MAG TPA: DUF4326 domain-containing protein [Polyangiaceae bacterium]|jgi:hypothetical protein|nr:DUF4326 domain-containing protein [Polyangiaceae bacterium]
MSQAKAKANSQMPVRVQRSRAKGSHLKSPNALPVVVVSRGTRWGNPFRMDDYKGRGGPKNKEAARAWSVAQFRAAFAKNKLAYNTLDVRAELRGKNLACWCPLDGPCHADILLEVANSRPKKA